MDSVSFEIEEGWIDGWISVSFEIGCMDLCKF